VNYNSISTFHLKNNGTGGGRGGAGGVRKRKGG